ncbi:hypothetical protein GCM10017708_14410 [Arthrobacter citreus]
MQLAGHGPKTFSNFLLLNTRLMGEVGPRLVKQVPGVGRHFRGNARGLGLDCFSDVLSASRRILSETSRLFLGSARFGGLCLG